MATSTLFRDSLFFYQFVQFFFLHFVLIFGGNLHILFLLSRHRFFELDRFSFLRELSCPSLDACIYLRNLCSRYVHSLATILRAGRRSRVNDRRVYCRRSARSSSKYNVHAHPSRCKISHGYSSFRCILFFRFNRFSTFTFRLYIELSSKPEFYLV